MRRLLAFALAVGALLAPVTAHAAVGEWTSVGPAGGEITVLAADPAVPGRFYAGGEGGVFRSDDGGVTWARAADGLRGPRVEAVSADPLTPGTVYAATEVGLFRSVDAGAHWAAVGAPLGRKDLLYAVAASPLAAGEVYAAADDATYRSGDGGATWQVVHPRSGRAFAFDQTRGAVHMAAQDRLLTSTDAGATWSPRTPPTLDYVDAIAADGAGALYAIGSGWVAPRLMKSVDGGLTWTRLRPGVDLTSGGLVVSGSHLYAGWQEIAASADGGATWTRADVPRLSQTRLAVDAADPALVLVAGFPRGIYRSADAGASWTRPAAPPRAHRAVSLAADPARPGVVHAGFAYAWQNGPGVRTTRDAGATWDPFRLAGGTVSDVAVAPSAPRVVYATTDAVYRSGDRGATWRRASGGLPAWSSVTGLAVHPARPWKAWAAVVGPYETRIFATRDGGRHWRPVGASLGGRLVWSLAVDPARPAVRYAGTPTGVLRTADRGRTWRRVATGELWSFAFAPGGTVFAATMRGLRVSRDGGRTFTAAAGAAARAATAVAVDPARPSRVYLATATPAGHTAVLASGDGGRTWAPLDGLGQGTVVYALSVDAAGTVYAGTAGASVFTYRPD